MVEYSPVCDSNLAAYIAYLSVAAIKNGAGLQRDLPETRGGDLNKVGGGGLGDGGAVVSVFNAVYDKARGGLAGVGSDFTTPGVRDYLCDVLGVESRKFEGGTSGLAGVHDVTGDGNVAASVCGGDKDRSGHGTSSQRVPVAPVVGCLQPGQLPRGPNYARNQEARMRKRIQKDEAKLAAAREAGRREVRAEVGVERKNWRTATVVEPSAAEKKLRELQVERMILQEERKLQKLKSPEQILEDAMRQVAFAERCAKLANNSKVAGWAATISTAHSESIARSAPNSVPSLDSVTSSRSEKEKRLLNTTPVSTQVKKKPFDASGSLTYFETRAIERKVITERDLRGARTRAGRPLKLADLLDPRSGCKMSEIDKFNLISAENYKDVEPDYHCY